MNFDVSYMSNPPTYKKYEFGENPKPRKKAFSKEKIIDWLP